MLIPSQATYSDPITIGFEYHLGFKLMVFFYIVNDVDEEVYRVYTVESGVGTYNLKMGGWSLIFFLGAIPFQNPHKFSNLSRKLLRESGCLRRYRL